MTHDPELHGNDTLTLEQAFQDGLLAKRLPEWVARLGKHHLDQWSAALKNSLACRQQLNARLSGIRGISEFARTTLQQALDERFGPGLDVSKLYFRQGFLVPSGEQLYTSRVPAMVPEYVQIPLLEAAMNNFVDEEAHQQLLGNALVTESGAHLKRPTAIEFANLCRTLDIGARYQRHLDANLTPTADPGMAGAPASSLLRQLLRSTLLVDAFKAKADGVLNAAELAMLVGLYTSGTLPKLNGARVVARQLRVLGCDLQQIIVFDVLDEGWVRTTSKRVLVYIPGDPHGPWSAFSDLQQFSRKLLGRRLRGTPYLKFFSRFVRRRDRQRFFPTVIELYRGVPIWATRDLDEHMRAYPVPLFEHLASMRIRQLKDDAAVILPPVAQIDRAVQREHERELVAQGWTLIGVASLFVPAIGAVLLAMMAWELLCEVFHGIEDWHDGDTAAALDHLSNIAVDLALAGATVAGVSVARRAWARSAVVDSLVSAPMEQGGVKLWNQDLTTFQGAAPQVLADMQGVRRQDGQAWIEMQGHHYPVRQRATDGSWQMMPREGFGPRLLGNGGGAWRLASDQPSCWTSAHTLFRRLGGAFGELDDGEIDTVLSIHGLGEDNLRALHMACGLPDPWLTDTVRRVQLQRRIFRLIQQLRTGAPSTDRTLLQHAQRLRNAAGVSGAELAEQVQSQRLRLLQDFYDSVQPSDSQAVAILRRVFPGLHHRAAQALVDAADINDLRRLSGDQRVPMRLGELARASVQRIRRIRVLEALHFDLPQPADLGRVAIGLLDDLQGAAQGVRWHYQDAGIGGPVLAESEQGQSDFHLLHYDGRFQLVDQYHAAQGSPGELFETMVRAFNASQRAAMGLAQASGAGLRQLLAGEAAARPERVEQLLAPPRVGMFQTPRRMEDGRFGYLLSGRQVARGTRQGRPQALGDRVHRLFPNLDQVQIDAWLSDVRASGQRVEPLLQRLDEQSQLLQRHMQAWVEESGEEEGRQQRRYLSNSLVECWQRSSSEEFRQASERTNLWWSQMGAQVDRLPDLPEQIRFQSVVVLSLRQMDISAIPDGFLQAFENLRVMELPGNALTRLPMQLQNMRRLQCLDLSGNRIILDPAQSTILAGCEQLSYLNLSGNPLGRVFSVGAMPHLTELRLHDTQIDCLPYNILQCPRLHTLDVRDNRITALPVGFLQGRLWAQGRVWLEGNSLSAEQAQALQAALPVSRPLELPQGPDVFPRMRWLDAIDPQYRDDLGSLWALVESNEGSEPFFELVNGLAHTGDFRSQAGAADLATRLLEMLRAMESDDALRRELFTITRDVTCQDSVALRFSDLEVHLRIWEAQHGAIADGQEQVLLRLGRQLWRLEAVDRIALEDFLSRQVAGEDPDEVEVVLAYRLALRSDLDLPVRITTMRFGYLADVGAVRVKHALERVLAAESSEQVARSLVERDFWQDHLKRTHKARFDELNEPYYAQVAALFDDHEQEEGVRMQRMAEVEVQRSRAEREAMLSITREALDVMR
ncbi:TPA: hypothetical protein SMP92_002792 [Pseudomonas putida]|nr:hypothetical protein [Pseudomonas putida]